MTKPDDIPADVWGSTEALVPDWVPASHIDDYRAEQARAILSERERCAKVAERDADWSKFGKGGVYQWEDGPDGHRDYRLGIAAGRSIAAAIRSHS